MLKSTLFLPYYCFFGVRKIRPIQENIIGPIVKPLSAVGDFVTNFPVIFGILVDASLILSSVL